MSTDAHPQVPKWVLVRVLLGCLGSAMSAGALACTLGGAEGLGQHITELSPTNLRDFLTVGAALGLLPGLIVGALSMERIDRTGRPRILWTSLLHSFFLSLLPLYPLAYCIVGAIAGC